VLQWAREHDCPLDVVGMCTDAAMGGQLEVVKWARELDCPWDENTCAFAAVGGHLPVGLNCPWGVRTCVWAAEGAWRC